MGIGDPSLLATRHSPLLLATRHLPISAARWCASLPAAALHRTTAGYTLTPTTFQPGPIKNVRWRITEITAKPTSTDSGQRWAFCGGSGLVRGARDGRSIIYRADVDSIRTLIACA